MTNLVTDGEIALHLSSMAPNKAPGLDRITAKMVKVARQLLLPPLVRLFNSCLREAVFPDIWKTADVVAIPKSPGRDRSSPKAFHPVSLLPVLGKTLEKSINLRLKEQCAKSFWQAVRVHGRTWHRARHHPLVRLD